MVDGSSMRDIKEATALETYVMPKVYMKMAKIAPAVLSIVDCSWTIKRLVRSSHSSSPQTRPEG